MEATMEKHRLLEYALKGALAEKVRARILVEERPASNYFMKVAERADRDVKEIQGMIKKELDNLI